MSEIKQARILVMGVGGGGCNAVDSMIEAGVKSAEFAVVNTDNQALLHSPCSNKISIGKTTTKGLGAGARPDVGKGAAEEAREEIREYLNDIDMLFITAGMGGGTGTGAAPVIAQMAREKKILTVAVVTKPFEFEGPVRQKNAEAGIEELKKYVDSLIVIPNNNLLKVMKNASMIEAFIAADKVLKDAISGITDVIATPSKINLDFADVRTIMKDKGIAHMAIGEAEGEGKVYKATYEAIQSDLIGTNIAGATNVLVYMVGGTTLGLEEVTTATTLIRQCTAPDCNIIFGTGFEENIGDKVKVLLVGTGFEENRSKGFAGLINKVPQQGMTMDNEKFKEMYGKGFRVGMEPVQPQQQNQQQYNNNYTYQAPQYSAQPRPQVNYANYGYQAPQQPQQPVSQPVQPVQQKAPTQEATKVTPPWIARIKNRGI